MTNATATATAPALRRSKDRKVQVTARVANAFGLPGGAPSAGGSCPGATELCAKDCYAIAIEKRFPKNVSPILRGNLETLQGLTARGMTETLSAMLGEFSAECAKRGVEPLFRWHWDGDVFSRDYAAAIRGAMRANPGVKGWIYTRSFEYVPILAGIPNLSLYLSVDAFNAADAAGFVGEPGIRFAFLGTTWLEATALASLLGVKPGPKCPELTGALSLTNETGQGACITCGLCPEGRANVRFASDKKSRKAEKTG